MSYWDQEMCLELISEYRKQELLWNPRHNFYNNILKKERSWIKIGKKLDRGVNDVKMKIERLRGAFRREKSRENKSLASGQSKRYISRWFAFDKLKFLDEFNESKSLLNDMLEIEIIEGKRDNTNDDINQTDEEGKMQLENNPKLSVAKRKASYYKDREDTEAYDRDECNIFGDLIASKLRKLDDRLRVSVQRSINNILFTAEMTTCSSHGTQLILNE